MAAQIKLLEAWKAVHVEGYAIVLDPYSKVNPLNTHELRTECSMTQRDLKLPVTVLTLTQPNSGIWHLAL